MTTTTHRRNAHHQAAIEAKADRGITAIRALAAKLLNDWDEFDGELAALRFINQELVWMNSPAMWASVGLAHDLLYGSPRGSEVTDFRTSREVLFRKLAALIDGLAHPFEGDPFAGLVD